MLKLTHMRPMVDGGTCPVYIMASSIVALVTLQSGTTVCTVAKDRFDVIEAPEQIMAMPEMVRAMNPLVTVSSTFNPEDRDLVRSASYTR